MKYVKVTDGVPAPYSLVRLRRDNPQVGFPKAISAETLALYGVHQLIIETKPSVTEAQIAVRNDPVEQPDGTWLAGLTVRDKTPDELQADQDAFDALVALVEGETARDKVLFRLIVDIWQAVNPGMTRQQALAAVRSRSRTHMQAVRGT